MKSIESRTSWELLEGLRLATELTKNLPPARSVATKEVAGEILDVWQAKELAPRRARPPLEAPHPHGPGIIKSGLVTLVILFAL